MKLTIEGTSEELKKVLQAITSSEEQAENAFDKSDKTQSIEITHHSAISSRKSN